MLKLFTGLMALFISMPSGADTPESLVMFYDEAEEGVGVQSSRYLVNDKFLRIDNGDAAGDYILFDVNSNNIYSINHEDKTILKISASNWSRPDFDFKFTEQVSVLDDAPKINNQKVSQYQLSAAGKNCTQVFFLKGQYTSYMKVMYAYQQVLSGQQVATLNNTPAEMQTPCFLLDQIYHTGEYFLQGMPIQISYSRGYAKYLKHYEIKTLEPELFTLPEGYSEYLPFAR